VAFQLKLVIDLIFVTPRDYMLPRIKNSYNGRLTRKSLR